MLIGSREYLDITATGQPGPSPLTLKSESPSDTPSASRTSLVKAGESVILTRIDSSEWATLEASPSSSGPDGRSEHDVGTWTVTGEEDEVSAAAVLIQTDLPVLQAQLPHLNVAHAHRYHPSPFPHRFSREPASSHVGRQPNGTRYRRLSSAEHADSAEVMSVRDCQSPRSAR